MPDRNTLQHPAYNASRQGMQFSSALIIISENYESICRRKKWGCSIKHVYFESSGTESERLILVNDSGKLDIYIPSIDDLKAHDWLVG